jgi:hypothetical protein
LNLNIKNSHPLQGRELRSRYHPVYERQAVHHLKRRNVAITSGFACAPD